MRKLLYIGVLGFFISPTIAGNLSEGNSSLSSDAVDEYYTGLKFVMDSQRDLTNKYFNLDYSDQSEDELVAEENIVVFQPIQGTLGVWGWTAMMTYEKSIIKLSVKSP